MAHQCISMDWMWLGPDEGHREPLESRELPCQLQ